MRAAWTAGYPVPEVFDADGRDLVMEHLEGPTMLKSLGDRPWRFERIADQLAELHTRLAGLPIDDSRAPGAVRARRVSRAPRPAPRQRHADAARPGRHRLVERRDGSARRRCRDRRGSCSPSARPTTSPSRCVRSSARSGGDCSAASSTGVDRPAAGVIRMVAEHRLTDWNLRPGELDKLRRFLEQHAPSTLSADMTGFGARNRLTVRYVEEDQEAQGSPAAFQGEPRQTTQHGLRLSRPWSCHHRRADGMGWSTRCTVSRSPTPTGGWRTEHRPRCSSGWPPRTGTPDRSSTPGLIGAPGTSA